MIGKSIHDKLRYAQELLSHQVPSGDPAEVLDRALDALIAKLEKNKFAGTTRPHGVRQNSKAGTRHISAAVRRAVWKRDEGRCTYVTGSGTRCHARKFIEFDHAHEYARGGEAVVGNVRLRCRAHNQYTAEQKFGTGFMNQKRQIASQAGWAP